LVDLGEPFHSGHVLSTQKVLLLKVSPWPYLQMLDKAGKACHGQRKMFDNYRCQCSKTSPMDRPDNSGKPFQPILICLGKVGAKVVGAQNAPCVLFTSLERFARDKHLYGFLNLCQRQTKKVV